MMIKVKILNLMRFLEIVNQCKGDIIMLCSDGYKANITRRDNIQRVLKKQYLENDRSLPLSLIIHNPKDYFAIVNYCIGDC